MDIYCLIYENNEKVQKVLNTVQFLAAVEADSVADVDHINIAGYIFDKFNISELDQNFIVRLIRRKYGNGVSL